MKITEQMLKTNVQEIHKHLTNFRIRVHLLGWGPSSDEHNHVAIANCSITDEIVEHKHVAMRSPTKQSDEIANET